MEHVNVRFGDVSAHFTVRSPIGFSRAPSPRRGSMPTEPGLALNTGCLGRDPVARASRLLAIERACTAPEPCATLGEATRAPDRRFPEQGCEAHAAAVGMGRDRHRPPGSVQVAGHHPSGTPRVQPNSLCRRVNVLSRSARRREPGRDVATPNPPPARATGAAIALAECLARGLEPRDWQLDALATPGQRASMRYQ